jgi:hypothetical protein
MGTCKLISEGRYGQGALEVMSEIVSMLEPLEDRAA